MTSENVFRNTATNAISSTSGGFDKFHVNIEHLMNFIFDPSLQWPLACGRLFAFALYGPLDENGNLKTGPKGSHLISVWELDEMCMQIEREDIMQVYLHKGGDMGLLTSAQQAAIIVQADNHLKKAKGKAMLPRLTKKDVLDILQDIPRFPDGTISFHETQIVLCNYRAHRISQFKRVYPSLVMKSGDDDAAKTGTNQDSNLANSQKSNSGSLSLTRKTQRPRPSGKVSEAVAPKTMFLRLKGSSNPDVIRETNSMLNKYSAKICTLDTVNSPSLAANVRLLREVLPVCSNPYEIKGSASINGLGTRYSRDPWESNTLRLKK